MIQCMVLAQMVAPFFRRGRAFGERLLGEMQVRVLRSTRNRISRCGSACQGCLAVSCDRADCSGEAKSGYPSIAVGSGREV